MELLWISGFWNLGRLTDIIKQHLLGEFGTLEFGILDFGVLELGRLTDIGIMRRIARRPINLLCSFLFFFELPLEIKF